MILNKDLKRRLLTISYKKGLSHLGSVLTAVDIIDEIFKIKKPEEKFILSSGHAALALYVVLEKYGGKNAEEIFDHHGVHPDRCSQCHIDVSAGSLGHGCNIAIGMALANRHTNVYTLSSDGETEEGSFWEGLKIAKENNLTNLKWYLNCNDYGAYKKIDFEWLKKRISAFDFPVQVIKTTFPKWAFITDPQEFHYKILNEEEYNQVMSNL